MVRCIKFGVFPRFLAVILHVTSVLLDSKQSVVLNLFHRLSDASVHEKAMILLLAVLVLCTHSGRLNTKALI